MTDTIERLQTALRGRYRIEHELGRGGMATVYLAEDLKHHRRVAIKVLIPDASLFGPERFLREIEITAGLSHPHIVPLYDSGELRTGGATLVFYVMPYIAGESLRARLERDRQLPIDEAISITREVADALTYAHNLGVVHRDIKPENILLQDGHARVADFGIARAVSEAGSMSLTATGAALGTPNYMSPEQATAERDIDGRTDVYALGCMLYEMLSGQPPYTGPTAPAVISRHLTAPPPNVRQVRGSVPERVDSAITRALAKERADRFDTPQAFADALGAARSGALPRVWQHAGVRIAAGVLALLGIAFGFDAGGVRSRIMPSASGAPAPEGSHSIAVLPFANVSGDSAEDYFSDGLTDELTTALSQVRAMRVAARTSSFQFKKQSKDVREIGKALNVSNVLVGSVRKSGQRVRVTAQLIDVATGLASWSSSYDERALADIFDIQSDIALRIARALEANITPRERQRITRKPTENLEAYTLYLRGRQAWHQRGESLFTAIKYFRQAIAVDPSYAQAYAGLASVYPPLGVQGFIHPREAREQMRAAVSRAIALDSNLAASHTALAAYQEVYEWNWGGAEREYKRAIALDPNDATAYLWYNTLLNAVGRFDEALAAARKSRDLDPLAPMSNMKSTYRSMGRFDEAVSESHAAVDLHPSVGRLHEELGMSLLGARRYDEAVREFELAVSLVGRSPNPKAELALALALGGRKDDARRLITELRAAAAATDIYFPTLAGALGAVEGNDAAFAWLERSVAQRHPDLYPIKYEVIYAALRSDARFRDILRRMGLEGQE